MKVKVLTSPLDKGMKWQERSTRQIEICKSGDHPSIRPTVYFGIKNKNRIIADFFLPPGKAKKIATELLKQAEIARKIRAKQKRRFNKRNKKKS